MSEALRLADAMTHYFDERGPDAEEVAAELRRLHALNAELVEALRGYISDYQSEDGMYSEKHYVKAFSTVLAKVETGNGS